MEGINQFELAQEQNQWLAEKSQTAIDMRRQHQILRKRINFLSVTENILSETRRPGIHFHLTK